MTSNDSWNPAQYEKFKAERSRPFYDLLALVKPVQKNGRVIDLGCGTGELTLQLHRHLGSTEMLGVDDSEAMLRESSKFASGGLQFKKMDIREFNSEPCYDLIFSNAALQWVDGHQILLRRFSEALRPAGQIAIQVPANFDHPSHEVAAEVAHEARFARLMQEGTILTRESVLSPESYAELLYALGFKEQHVRLQVYPHELESSSAVVEWVRGSCLTAYQKRLPPEVWPDFLARYQARLLERIGSHAPYFYAFKRILMWGQRA